jgi:hypothetical protein
MTAAEGNYFPNLWMDWNYMVERHIFQKSLAMKIAREETD